VNAAAVAEAVKDWALATIPELRGGYAFVPAGKTEGLPDVVVAHGTIEVVFEDRQRFPTSGLQQTVFAVHSLGLSIMVDNADEAASSVFLLGVCDALAASLLGDVTLDGRVPICSPIMTFDLTRPYVQYQDGTEGREMTMDMFVGVPMEA
jgi:hypothetical protein